MRACNYSSDEIQYIEDSWGTKTPDAIAKALNRSISGIINKAVRRQLGPFLESGDYITVNQLFKALGRNGSISYTLDKWIKKGFPVKRKRVVNNSFKIIYLEDFWEWAEEYRMHINFSKFKENALGKEPEWAKEQRKADVEFAKYKITPWTKEDDEIFKSLLKLYKYTYRELSIRILRTEGAIKRRINDLCLNTWPIREPPHSKWTSEQENIVIEMYKKGYRPAVIKEYIEKSEQAINGRIERLIRDGLLIKWK